MIIHIVFMFLSWTKLKIIFFLLKFFVYNIDIDDLFYGDIKSLNETLLTNDEYNQLSIKNLTKEENMKKRLVY